jgi:hypothetical protein
LVFGGLTEVFDTGQVGKGGLGTQVANGGLALRQAAGGDDLVEDRTQGFVREDVVIVLTEPFVDL